MSDAPLTPQVAEAEFYCQCRIVRRRFQQGLLAAVKHRLSHADANPGMSISTVPPRADHFNRLVQDVLKAAVRSILFQLIVILSWWNL